MFDYWLWRRERRIHAAAAFWPATLLALPGVLIAGHFLPLVYNTIDGFSVLAHGCAAGAGLGVGLAVSLRGFSGGARAEWTGLVLGVTLVAGALVVHWNADVPDAERTWIDTRVVDGPVVPKLRPWFRARDLERIYVEWEGRPREAIVTLQQGPFREGTPVRLSVYAGRIGYRVIERVRPAD